MVVDFHSHILPNIDDGSESTDMSIDMLLEMKRQGTDFVVASPHFYALKRSVRGFLADRSIAVLSLRDALLSRGLSEGRDVPKILLGAEIAYSFEIEKLKDINKLRIEGSNALLMELPFRRWTREEIDALANLTYSRNFNVIIAHCERYIGLQKEDIATMLFELPVYIQINAGALRTPIMRQKVLKMFAEGKSHVIGSDAHNMSFRKPCIDVARAVIKSKLGERKLREIDESAQKIINI